ncbi:MAG: MerR family transcriptional regulator [Spirochaetes bacterium]|nr:MerR family transcriptional regulator [Spirochaetota bacterium]
MSDKDRIKIYQIGEVARLVDISQRTMRYYEEIGLMNSVRRIEGGKRVYTDDDVRRLKLIKRLKVLGLTLSEMHELEAIWSIRRSNDVVLRRLLEILDSHLQRIEDRIADLDILKNEIAEYQRRINAKLTE